MLRRCTKNITLTVCVVSISLPFRLAKGVAYVLSFRHHLPLAKRTTLDGNGVQLFLLLYTPTNGLFKASFIQSILVYYNECARSM